MKNQVQKIPFLRITLAFALGIFLSGKVSVQPVVMVSVAVLLLSLLFFINKNYEYKYELPFGWIISLLFMILGAVVYTGFNQTPRFLQNGKFAATVLETPEEKPNSYKSILKITAFYKNDSVFNTREKVLAYFEKTKSAGSLQPGCVVLFESNPRYIKNNGNPYEFDYRQYMARKKIYRQVYLNNESWKKSDINRTSLMVWAEKARNNLLNIYRNQQLGENETEILSALTLGYKRGLDPETKRVFSSAGAMHVLAVSGLHVGILFAVFSWIFGFLRKSKSGRYIFIFGAITILWGYAFITGFSPSVMRASTMFSLFCIAANIQRSTRIYNSLAIAAFVILLINPNNLFEVGFQLSFAAVFGIVFLQPKLSKIWPVRNRIIKFFWALLTVSIAAQIATFPVTSYYFNQFPSYFWISNLVVIPAAFVLIIFGIGLLALSHVPYLSTGLAFLTKWLIHGTYIFLKSVEELPGSVLPIRLSLPETILLIITFSSIFLFIKNQRIRSFQTALLFLLIILTISLINQYNQLTHAGMVVYNNTSNPVIHLFSGKENYVISEKPISENDFILREIKNIQTQKQLLQPVFLTFDNTFGNHALFLKDGTLCFKGKIIRFDTQKFIFLNNLQYDFIITRNSQHQAFNFSGTSPICISLSDKPSESDNPAFFPTAEKGAYIKQWQPERFQTNAH